MIKLSLSQTLPLYLLMAATYFGWGKVAAFILRLPRPESDPTVMTVWLGWASSLLVFQVLHFFVPLSAFVVAPVFGVGIVICIARWREALAGVSRQPFYSAAAVVVILFFMACWIAVRSMVSPTSVDSGLYHFNAIRWINSYPIVPGLGNLHGRLAFNHSFFTYVATLNLYPYFNHGRGLASSFLLLLMFAQVVSRLASALWRPELLTKSHPFVYASDLLVLPLLCYLALSSDGFDSPQTDLPSAFLQLAMFLALVHGIGEWRAGVKQQDHRAVVLAILAATAVTVKLSSLAFAFVVVCVCVAYAYLCRDGGGRTKRLLRVLLPPSVIILVWCLRGIVLSGYPLFPSTVGGIPVDWQVPRGMVMNEANWVYSWARLRGVDKSLVLGNWNWLVPWFRNVSHNFTEVVYPLLSWAGLCVAAVACRASFLRKRRLPPRHLERIVLLPLVSGLVYWFFAAPDIRFAGAIFWMLPVSSALLLLVSLRPSLKPRHFLMVVVLIFVVLNLHFILFAVEERSRFMYFSTSGWQPIRAAKGIAEYRLASGLSIYVSDDGLCWDSYLLCTPSYRLNPNLKLRVPGKISSGFTVSGISLYRE